MAKKTSTHYVRYMEDQDGSKYVNISDLLKILRSKMRGSAADVFVNELSAELYEGVEKAYSGKG